MITLPSLPTITFRMKRRHKIAVGASLVLICALAYVSVHDATFAILEPRGFIAQEQYDLLVFATLLSLIIIIPVFTLLACIIWRYREGSKGAQYKPDWGGNISLELVWWGIPIILICILAIVTWRSSHALDPYRPLESSKRPVRIQVIALQWKWLFIYPEEGVASLNYLRVPEDRPINFELTSDAPMNSFWIPQLGGQVYAMSGMTSKLHLIANEQGKYRGLSANISGEGFADMKFIAEATSDASYNQWLKHGTASRTSLDATTYLRLTEPSVKDPRTIYKLADTGIFDSAIMKYMNPRPLAQEQPVTDHTHDSAHQSQEGHGH